MNVWKLSKCGGLRVDLSVPHHRLALGLGAVAMLVAAAGAVRALRRHSDVPELGLLERLG